MKASPALRDFLMKEEAVKLKAYLCPAGVWTIGVGATLNLKGQPVHEGEVITKEQAIALLERDITRFEKQVSRLVKVPLNQWQFDALVSFTFNLGGGALEGSTLLKKLNKGDYKGAAKEFDKWVYANKKPLAGLKKRRAEERRMFEVGGMRYAADSNNEPLHNRDLPLPTVMREGIEVTDSAPVKPVTKAVIGGAGIGVAGTIIDLANQAAPAITPLTYLSWQVGLGIVIVVAVGVGVWYFVKSRRG